MVSFWLVAGLALIGLFGKRLWRAPPALWVIPVLFLLSSVPVLGMSRIRAPIDPFLVFAAGLGVLALADRFLGAHNRLARSRGEPAEPTAALVPSVSAEVLAPAEPLA
jgi:hypothetical protein